MSGPKAPSHITIGLSPRFMHIYGAPLAFGLDDIINCIVYIVGSGATSHIAYRQSTGLIHSVRGDVVDPPISIKSSV